MGRTEHRCVDRTERVFLASFVSHQAKGQAVLTRPCRPAIDVATPLPAYNLAEPVGTVDGIAPMAVLAGDKRSDGHWRAGDTTLEKMVREDGACAAVDE